MIGKTVKWDYEDLKGRHRGAGQVQSRTIENGEPVLWVTRYGKPYKQTAEALVKVPERLAKEIEK